MAKGDKKLPKGNRAPAVELGTSTYRQKYLFAFAGQPEVRQYLRTQMAKADTSRIPELLAAWTQIQQRVADTIAADQNLAERIAIEDLPDQNREAAARMLDNDLFRKSFHHRTHIALVEIDKLVAAQRMVNLDYVEQVKASFAKELTLESLIKICLSLERSMAPIQHLELGPGTHVFSSPSTDLRFLGAFEKKLTADDSSYAEGGGIPVSAIINFVGYGASPINAFLTGTRVVLNNGFHRVYALRSLGVTKIPVVLQLAHNPAMEFPDHVGGIPKQYLLGHPRPVLMRDFFEDDFSIVINVQKRIRVVTLHVNVSQHDVPA